MLFLLKQGMKTVVKKQAPEFFMVLHKKRIMGTGPIENMGKAHYAFLLLYKNAKSKARVKGP